MKISPITVLDFYKTGHLPMYPEGLDLLYNNFTPRSNRLSNLTEFNDKIVWVGLQPLVQWFLIDMWNEEFFGKPEDEVVSHYARRVRNAVGEPKVDQIRALHRLGYLPIHIKALPEGSRVPMRVPVYTCQSTHKDFAWLANGLETALSTESWKAPTVATSSYAFVKLLERFAMETTGDKSFANFQAHDFSARGLSGIHDGATVGAAHLTSSYGTDTVHAIDHLENYYGADSDKELVGVSVFADEHSVVCANISNTVRLTGCDVIEAEEQYIERLITQVCPAGIVSHVSDTNNYWKIIGEVIPRLKDVITGRKRDSAGMAKLVLRPDSGLPEDILCGVPVKVITSDNEAHEDVREELWREDVAYDLDEIVRKQTPHGEQGGGAEGLYRFNDQVYRVEYEPEWDRHDKQYYFIDNYNDTVDNCTFTPVELTLEEKGSLNILWETFGGTTSDQGYKVLDPSIGLIYGDSITFKSCKAILTRMKEMGFASTNVVFGVGSYTMQYVTRDTFGFALKATYGEVEGNPIELFKNPITGNGVKKSAKGLLRVELEDGDYVLYDQQTKEQEAQGELKTVFKDGEAFNFQTLSEIRARLDAQ